MLLRKYLGSLIKEDLASCPRYDSTYRHHLRIYGLDVFRKGYRSFAPRELRLDCLIKFVFVVTKDLKHALSVMRRSLLD